MPTFNEGKLSSIFPDTWDVTKYDKKGGFYGNQFGSCCGGNRAVDFLAYDPGDRTLWLIELKDYRRNRRSKPIDLCLEIALKARDTLAGVFAAAINATGPEQRYAVKALSATKLRVVLHLEQPRTHSKLFPRAYDPADVQQKLKQTLKPIDAHPKVVELSNMDTVPWNAVSIP